MLSEKVKSYLVEEGLYDDTEDVRYQKVISDLNIQENSAFSDFHQHTNAVTFSGRMFELYNICWFTINASYNFDIERTHNALKLPKEYLPLDSFEAEGGFFYNKITDEVLEIELGDKLKDFIIGKFQPQWKTFNEFLEWYFELS